MMTNEESTGIILPAASLHLHLWNSKPKETNPRIWQTAAAAAALVAAQGACAPAGVRTNSIRSNSIQSMRLMISHFNQHTWPFKSHYGKQISHEIHGPAVCPPQHPFQAEEPQHSDKKETRCPRIPEWNWTFSHRLIWLHGRQLEEKWNKIPSN